MSKIVWTKRPKKDIWDADTGTNRYMIEKIDWVDPGPAVNTRFRLYRNGETGPMWVFRCAAVQTVFDEIDMWERQSDYGYDISPEPSAEEYARLAKEIIAEMRDAVSAELIRQMREQIPGLRRLPEPEFKPILDAWFGPAEGKEALCRIPRSPVVDFFRKLRVRFR